MDEADVRKAGASAPDLVNESVTGILQSLQMPINISDFESDMMKTGPSGFEELVYDTVVLHRVPGPLAGGSGDLGCVHRLNNFQVPVACKDEKIMDIRHHLRLARMRDDPLRALIAIDEVLYRRLDLGVELLAS
jgi:hypothetical protein